MRVIVASVVLVFLFVVGLVAYFLWRSHNLPQFHFSVNEVTACDNAQYKQVRTSMNAAQVVSILGEPDVKIQKRVDDDGSQFGQGANEKNIQESWNYIHLGPDVPGSRVIFLNAEGIVVGKTCGEG